MSSSNLNFTNSCMFHQFGAFKCPSRPFNAKLNTGYSPVRSHPELQTKMRARPTVTKYYNLNSNLSESVEIVASSLNNRRSILQAFFLTVTFRSKPVLADETPIVQGIVTIDEGVYFTVNNDSALYITVRPPGKGPPLAGIRIPASNLHFPYSFNVSASDLYPDAPDEQDWKRRNLVVSSRLDLDGTAATRDPEDLVGRGESIFNKSDGRQPTQVILRDRGVGGRFVTKKQ